MWLSTTCEDFKHTTSFLAQTAAATMILALSSIDVVEIMLSVKNPLHY